MNLVQRSQLALLALLSLCAWSAAHAATITVNTTADQWNTGGNCSLREAVNAINNGANGRGCSATGSYGTNDTVIVPAGTYALTRTGSSSDANGDIDIRASMLVIGDGGGTSGTIVDASAVSDSGFEVLGGTVSLIQLRITGGAATANFRGGGVQNQSGATLTISQSTIIGNTGQSRAAGGVGNSGTLSIQYSTVTDNTNADTIVGAGVDNNNGTLTVTNSTVSGNNGDGPGVFLFSGTGRLVNATLSGNATAGVTAENGTSNAISNTIVNDGCLFIGGGTITDGDYNIDSGASCGFSAGNSQNNTNPNLGPLADNGGGTRTHAIDNTSPAFDQIPIGSNQCLGQITVDQRAAPRAGGTPDTGYSACDVGAYEYAPGYTLAVISDVRGFTNNAGQTLIEWTTVSEVGTAGFHLQRRDPSTRRFVNVTEALVPGLVESPQGGTYTVVDDAALSGESYTYRLVEVETSGRQRRYGPWRVTVDGAGASVTDGEWFSGRYRRTAHRSRRKAKRAAIVTSAPSARSARATAGATGLPMGKVGVRESGLYRLDLKTMAEMLGESEAAIKTRLAKTRLKLTHMGQQVSWFAANDNSALYFYAEALDSPYTQDNVYWLKTGPGRRMQKKSGVGAAPVNGGRFVHTEHFEQDLIPATSYGEDPDSDYWYWDSFIANHPQKGRGTYTLNVPGPLAGGEASVTIYLRGNADLVDGDDHRVEVSLNGAWIGDGSWNGRDSLALDLPVSPSLLREGNNRVEVVSTGIPAVSGSIVYLDAIEVTYSRAYRALQEALEHYADGNRTVTVTGFADERIHILEIAEPSAPRLYTDAVVDRGRDWRVSYRPIRKDAPHVAVSEAGAKQPLWTRSVRTAGLRGDHGANYVVIAPAVLQDGAKALASYREQSGLQTRLVLLEDIYNEFNEGLPSPHAIRRFLSFAHRKWSVRPRYVALVGKGTVDYRDILGHGDNLMPPMLVATDVGLFSADNAFADFNLDGVPEIAVGRIPARSNKSLRAYIDKLALFETNGMDPDVLMLSDDSDQGGNFWQATRDVAKVVPKGGRRKHLSLAKLPLDAARKRLFRSLRTGVGMVNYLGHGSVLGLAAEGLLKTSDVPKLRNDGRTPILAALSCVVNRFELAGYDSIGEELVLQEDAGMVAVWSASGVSLNREAVVLNKALYRAASAKPKRRLGDAIRVALKQYKNQLPESPTATTYNLIGDPATRLTR